MGEIRLPEFSDPWNIFKKVHMYKSTLHVLRTCCFTWGSEMLSVKFYFHYLSDWTSSCFSENRIQSPEMSSLLCNYIAGYCLDLNYLWIRFLVVFLYLAFAVAEVRHMLYSTPLVFIRASTPREAINLRTCQGRHHGESMGHFDVFFLFHLLQKMSITWTDNQSLFAFNVERTLSLSPLENVDLYMYNLNAFQKRFSSTSKPP